MSLGRPKQHAAVDHIDEMVALYNSDECVTYGVVAKRFGISSTRVQQLLHGRVAPRVGRPRKDGSRSRIKPCAAVFLPTFPTERELLRRREARLAALERDPDILRCRAERKRRVDRNAPLLAQAKREFVAQSEKIARGISHRSDGERRNRGRAHASPAA